MEQSDHRRPPRFSAVCGSSASMAMALKGSCGGASVRAPARSFAERARGLRAISCSLGPTGPRVIGIEGRFGRGCGRQVARACRRAAGARGEELLHDAVFEGMERHDDEPPAGLQDALGRMQRAHEFAELVVDGDAQGLEHARRRMNAAGLLADERCDEIGELPRRLEGLAPPRLDDGAGDGAGAPLLAVVIEDVGELGLGGFVDEIGRARAAALHAHVERPVVAEREAALGLVDLHRGHADVEHDAVERIETLRLRDLVEVAEASRNQHQAFLELGGQCSAPPAIASGSRSMATTLF